MDTKSLNSQAKNILDHLCDEIPNRRVGSVGNRAATDFFAAAAQKRGFEIETEPFECMDWTEGGARLTVREEVFDARVSPYSRGGQADGRLCAASTVAELESLDLGGQVLLLHGELAKEQLMPKNFPFYNPDHHKHVIALLEAKGPLAIIAATSRNPELAGGVYPFPLIEDGDFDIPSVYMTEEEGKRLTAHLGERVSLEITARRTPAAGCNIIASRGRDPKKRVVVFAHIDAKDGTPGAIDNAGGVVVLLLLAELLREYDGRLRIELEALNGEDYYDAPGEKVWVAKNADRFPEIRLGINIDAAGYVEGKSAYTLYGCDQQTSAAIHSAFAGKQGILEGEPWYQSDHGLFIQNGVPALAITSERFVYLSTEITHTPKDRPVIVDPARLVEIALGLRDLLLELDRMEKGSG